MKHFFGNTYRGVRLTVRLLISYLITNRRLFFFGLVVGISAIIFLPQLFASLSQKRSPVLGIVGNYTIATLPLAIQQELSIGLTRLLPSGEATSGAALTWISENQSKELTFKLDPNLFWQDGSQFSSADINYNLKGVATKELGSHEIRFSLQEPFAPLPVIVSQPLFKKGLVGLGEYHLKELRMNGRFIASLTIQSVTTGEIKTYKFYPSEDTAALALKLGEITSVAQLHSKYDFAQDSHYKIIDTTDYTKVATVFYNTRDDLLTDKTLRQALTYALPNTFPEGERAFSPIVPHNWAHNESVKHYPQNLGTLPNYLKKIATSSAKLSLNLATSRELLPTAESIAKIWTGQGMQTTVTIVNILPQNFDVYLAYLDLPSDPDQYALWHSTQRGNITSYKSARVDSLLENGRKTADKKERLSIYENFQRALTEDVPASFLFYPRIYTISRQ